MARPTDLETAFVNVSALVDLAQWHMLENSKRTGDDVAAPYEVAKREGDQLMALLVVTSDYANRVLQEYDESRQSMGGGAA